MVDEDLYMYLVPRELRDVGVLTESLTVAENAKQCVKRYAIPLATHDHHALLNQLCAESPLSSPSLHFIAYVHRQEGDSLGFWLSTSLPTLTTNHTTTWKTFEKHRRPVENNKSTH